MRLIWTHKLTSMHLHDVDRRGEAILAIQATLHLFQVTDTGMRSPLLPSMMLTAAAALFH